MALLVRWFCVFCSVLAQGFVCIASPHNLMCVGVASRRKSSVWLKFTFGVVWRDIVHFLQSQVLALTSGSSLKEHLHQIRLNLYHTGKRSWAHQRKLSIYGTQQ